MTLILSEVELIVKQIVFSADKKCTGFLNMYELVVEKTFAGAHNLRAYDGECERLHGHNWRVEVTLKAEKLNELGMVMDFKDIKKRLEEILSRFDHSYLNELSEFKEENPTTENVSKVIYDNLSEQLPPEIFVAKVKTWESEKCAAAYYI
ncbi:6-pyruvoyl-tetrahydropterin synthase [Candidatus Scalindua japonica]|uniref:6-carboxy-5,6,7,8-tetrahydropterin synthase n=1 Tax=Candidatus Scalindua japonica TaxID=1284222 RepID=A0A286U0Z4_9BACT|nr:6-carboxytetrahydropterin synthase QueD [Candidatus Scalindua japonica]GAX61788.1 6-pyruvoyl-tetrahydropterin synthase [Candidatus Scalindua japonica]